MKKIKKVFGETPVEVAVTVLDELTNVFFDEEGHAEVSEEVANVFLQIPGYEIGADAVVNASEDETATIDYSKEGLPLEEDTSEAEEVIEEEASEEEIEEDEEAEEVVAPKAPAKRSPAKRPAKR